MAEFDFETSLYDDFDPNPPKIISTEPAEEAKAVEMEPTPPEEPKPIESISNRKLFVAGLKWGTDQDSLRLYFQKFGAVVECSVTKDALTGRSRGFGFVVFESIDTLNRVLKQDHVIDGKMVDTKRAVPSGTNDVVEKLFVGGLSIETTSKELEEFFAQFGNILDATLVMDKDTMKSRGFGFVTFEDKAALNAALESNRTAPLRIAGKKIEIKRASPRSKGGEDHVQSSQDSRSKRHEPYRNRFSNSKFGKNPFDIPLESVSRNYEISEGQSHDETKQNQLERHERRSRGDYERYRDERERRYSDDRDSRHRIGRDSRYRDEKHRDRHYNEDRYRSRRHSDRSRR